MAITYQHSPWDKTTVTENDTPLRLGDRVTLDYIDRHTGKPEQFGERGKVYTISADDAGNLGITGLGYPDSPFYKPFRPLREFSHDVRFTLVERVGGVMYVSDNCKRR